MLLTAAQQEVLIYRIGAFFLTILATILLVKIVLFFMERASRNKFSSVMYKAQSFVPQVLYLLGFIIAISQLGLSIAVIILIVALFGIGFLMGSRRALENMISRFYLDLFSPYHIGDKITVGGYHGEVIEVNVLNTVLLDEKEEVILIPNSYLLSNTVINKSKDARHELHLPVVVSKKLSIMEFKEMEHDLLKHPKPVVVTTRTTNTSEEITLIVSIRSPEKRSLVTEKLKHRIEELIDDMMEKQGAFTPKEV